MAVVLYIVGFVLLGASFQDKLSVGALVMGWGIAEVAIMINTVAVCKSPTPGTLLRSSLLTSWLCQTHTVTTASRDSRARSPVS